MNILDKGQCIKGYIVESNISSHEFYETYKVVDENNTPYFLKIYDMSHTPKELLYENKEVLEFLNCMDLSHQNILEFIDKGCFSAVDKEYHYMITKFYQGELLEDHVNRCGKLSTAESVRIIKGVLNGVSYMHNYGILHNKINLSNVIIDNNLSPTIIDLGNSCRVGDKIIVYNTTENDFFYLANESFDGIHSKQSDIFSLTAILYKIITGKAPWQIDNTEKESINMISKYPNRLFQ